jgi:hypothetical protein
VDIGGRKMEEICKLAKGEIENKGIRRKITSKVITAKNMDFFLIIKNCSETVKTEIVKMVQK